MNIAEQKRALASALSRTGTAIIKCNQLSVNWLPENEPQLGYTQASLNGKAEVNVAWYFEPYFSTLSEEECMMMRTGIFAHELLHQVFTDFDYSHRMCQKLSRAEAGIFMMFANTLEDPAIEYHAPLVFGGKLLESLRFQIRHIYTVSPGIEHSRDAFSQLINALVYYGDMGIVKGNFTFPEAEKYFKRIAPIYNKGIQCPNARKRLEYADECKEICRPLWEESVKNEEFFEELMKKLAEELKKSGLHIMKEEEDDLSAPETETSKRRCKIAQKMEEEQERKEDASSEGESLQSNDGENAQSSEESNEESGSQGGGDDSNDESAETKESERNKESADKDQQAAKEQSDSRGNDSGESADTGSAPTDAQKDDYCMPEQEANAAAEESMPVSEKSIDEVQKMIENEIKMQTKENDTEVTSNESDVIEEFTLNQSDFTRNASCYNSDATRMSERYKGIYRSLAQNYSYDISNMTKRLKNLFRTEQEEVVRHSSGNYNIKRGSIGTSAKIFDKRREPSTNSRDTSIVILIDQSGSMTGKKIADARKAAIVLAESLSALHLPFYIMGFATRGGVDSCHLHYCRWNGKGKESLVTMDANGGNFDGYAIRYAAELLKRRAAKNKILFVISDGMPACNRYSSQLAGIADTANAIKECRRVATVFGIAIGEGCGEEVLQSMYGKDFIHVENSNLLTNILCKKLIKAMKK